MHDDRTTSVHWWGEHVGTCTRAQKRRTKSVMGAWVHGAWDPPCTIQGVWVGKICFERTAPASCVSLFTRGLSSVGQTAGKVSWPRVREARRWNTLVVRFNSLCVRCQSATWEREVALRCFERNVHHCTGVSKRNGTVRAVRHPCTIPLVQLTHAPCTHAHAPMHPFIHAPGARA